MLRVVGVMAANVVLPWSHRAFALMKRWRSGTHDWLAPKHVDNYSTNCVSLHIGIFYRHVSFESMLGSAANHAPVSYRASSGAQARVNHIAGIKL